MLWSLLGAPGNHQAETYSANKAESHTDVESGSLGSGQLPTLPVWWSSLECTIRLPWLSRQEGPCSQCCTALLIGCVNADKHCTLKIFSLHKAAQLLRESSECDVCVHSSRQERAADIRAESRLFVSCLSGPGRGSLNLAPHLWLMNSSLKQYVHPELLQRYVKVQLTGAWWSQWDDLLQLKAPCTRPAGAFPEPQSTHRNSEGTSTSE